MSNEPKITVDLSALAAEVAKLGAERPDHVNRAKAYGTCFYTYDDEVDGMQRCIVGEALSRLGVEDATLDGIVMTIDSLHAEGAVKYITAGMSADDVDTARRFVSEAQSHQDLDKPWGKAVALAAGASDYKLPDVAVAA